jgi:Fe-S-cluster containining protein
LESRDLCREEYMKSLEQYRLLLEKVDRFSGGVAECFGGGMVCRRGCDACCTHISVMAVEAVALALAVAALPAEEAEGIRERARRMGSDEACPLLEDGVCLLYAARPVICRSHGLPLLLEEDGQRRVDHCPLNFQGMESLPGDMVLNLETLNQALAAVNILCLQELGDAASQLPERLSIAEALLLELDEAR